MTDQSAPARDPHSGGSQPTTVTGSPGDLSSDGLRDAVWAMIKRLPAYARVVAAMTRDERVPATAKAYLVAGGAYLLSPIDLVPGIIPVAGQLDDLYVVLTGLQQAMRTTPQPVVDEHFAAHGLDPAAVDDDLATIRTVVRRSVTWSLRKGGTLVLRATRQAAALARRARQRGATHHDKEPL